MLCTVEPDGAVSPGPLDLQIRALADFSVTLDFSESIYRDAAIVALDAGTSPA